jgi:hypothetical protein
MHLSSSRMSNALCFSGSEGAFLSLPTGSFPVELGTRAIQRLRVEDCIGRQIISPSDCTEYREHRLSSGANLRRNIKISLARWRCRNSLKKSSRGVTTFDDFTADLYGYDVDDELPLLNDVYMHDQ